MTFLSHSHGGGHRFKSCTDNQEYKWVMMDNLVAPFFYPHAGQAWKRPILCYTRKMNGKTANKTNKEISIRSSAAVVKARVAARRA
jgi:hypothetical protein